MPVPSVGAPVACCAAPTGPSCNCVPQDACYLCEPKRASEMQDSVVLAKAKAAALWCARATEHAGGKPWKYLLIPHDVINDTKTVAGLAAGHLVTSAT